LIRRAAFQKFLRRVDAWEPSTEAGSQGKRDSELNTEEWLRRRATALRSRAAKIIAKAKTEADELLKDAERLEETAKKFLAGMDGGRRAGEQQASYREHVGLRERSHHDTVNRMLPAEHQLAISKSKSPEKKTDALVRAAQAKGMSLRALSRALEQRLGRPVPVSRLSMARRGLRPIDTDIASAVESLTGFEASSKNWPGGIA